VDWLEFMPAPDEYRDIYDSTYGVVRITTEVGTAVAIQGIPADKFGKLAKTLREIDWGQNTMMIGRAVLDVPELTRQGCQGWHLEWSEGMHNHGITSRNACELLGGLFGFRGHLVPLRGEGAATRRIVIVAQDGQRVTGFTIHGIDSAIGDTYKHAGTRPQAILDALKNPQRIERGIDPRERPYIECRGKGARVTVNPKTGGIVSVNPFSKAGAHPLH
jgi:hypothetical protein